MVVVWLSAWPCAGITSLYVRDAEEVEGSVRALCRVAILAAVPRRCLGEQCRGWVVMVHVSEDRREPLSCQMARFCLANRIGGREDAADGTDKIGTLADGVGRPKRL